MYLIIILYFGSYDSDYFGEMGIFFGPLLLLSLILHTIYLLLDKSCCCSGSTKCFCTCCCGPECYENNVHVIDISQNELEIVQIAY